MEGSRISVRSRCDRKSGPDATSQGNGVERRFKYAVRIPDGNDLARVDEWIFRPEKHFRMPPPHPGKQDRGRSGVTAMEQPALGEQHRSAANANDRPDTTTLVVEPCQQLFVLPLAPHTHALGSQKHVHE